MLSNAAVYKFGFRFKSLRQPYHKKNQYTMYFPRPIKLKYYVVDVHITALEKITPQFKYQTIKRYSFNMTSNNKTSPMYSITKRTTHAGPALEGVERSGRPGSKNFRGPPHVRIH